MMANRPNVEEKIQPGRPVAPRPPTQSDRLLVPPCLLSAGDRSSDATSISFRARSPLAVSQRWEWITFLWFQAFPCASAGDRQHGGKGIHLAAMPLCLFPKKLPPVKEVKPGGDIPGEKA